MGVVLGDVSIGAFGAVLQELLFWYNAKAKLASDEYDSILRSGRYWVVVTAMAIGSGAASYVWFTPDQQPARTYLLFGAAFPALFKKAVDAFVPKQTTLGVATKDKKILRSYFKAS